MFRKGFAKAGDSKRMLPNGALGLGLVIGWTGGFVGLRPAALAYRGATAALTLIVLTANEISGVGAAACGLAVAGFGHEGFVAALGRWRGR